MTCHDGKRRVLVRHKHAREHPMAINVCPPLEEDFGTIITMASDGSVYATSTLANVSIPISVCPPDEQEDLATTLAMIASDGVHTVRPLAHTAPHQRMPADRR